MLVWGRVPYQTFAEQTRVARIGADRTTSPLAWPAEAAAEEADRGWERPMLGCCVSGWEACVWDVFLYGT